MPLRSLTLFAAALALAACGPADDAPDSNSASANVAANDVAAADANAMDNVPLSDRPAPDPLTSGNPLPGEWDPDIMTVELAGERLVIYDAKHAWPLNLDNSDYEFARQGMASFGTPVLSHSIPECPAGKLDYLNYANGLELAFQGGKLVGYWVKEGSKGIATTSGIEPGSPRSKLGKVKIDNASFGKLVDIDGTIAILDDKETKVTDLYAGSACIFD